MRPGHHSTVTSAQREELWRQHKAGELVRWISHELDQWRTNLYCVLQAAGGIEPALHTRPPRVLSLGARRDLARHCRQAEFVQLAMHFVGFVGVQVILVHFIDLLHRIVAAITLALLLGGTLHVPEHVALAFGKILKCRTADSPKPLSSSISSTDFSHDRVRRIEKSDGRVLRRL